MIKTCVGRKEIERLPPLPIWSYVLYMQELKIEEEDEITGMKGIFCKRDHFVQFLYPGWKLMYKTTK